MSRDGAIEAIEVLNRALREDPKAIWALMLGTRVPCNLALADDKTIQVSALEKGGHAVGPLGLINGLFGVDKDSWGFITMHVDVVCTACGKVKGNSVSGDPCVKCGSVLVLGDVIKFSLTERKSA